MPSDFTLPERDAQMWAENPFNAGVHPSKKLLTETPPEHVREARNALSANQIARQASEEGGDNFPQPIKWPLQVVTVEWATVKKGWQMLWNTPVLASTR